jgi:hypothetical protein
MTLQEMLQQADDNGLIDQMAQQLGIEPGQARQGMAQLAPAVARGIQRSAAAPQGGGGIEDLLQLLGGTAAGAGAGAGAGGALGGLDGNAILGQIFGNKDVSRNVAGHASEQSGLDSSLLRQMLPLVASAAMMILSQRGQQAQQGGMAAGGTDSGQAAGGSTLGMLNKMFDADGDGSAVDDLLNMARRFF